MDQTDLAVIARRCAAVVLDESKTHRHRLQIRSETSTRLYVVAQLKTSGQWQCSCPGWIRHRSCKHLNAMLPMLRDA
jgi:hypothetical protein